MASTRGIRVLRDAGVAFTVHTYRHVLKGALPAADALGIDPARVAKTLVVLVDGEPVLAILPGTVELSLKAAARAAGGKAAVMAPPPVAERVTGYVTGGIGPFGLRRALPVLVDRSLTAHGSVLVNAGQRGVLVELAPADLVDACTAVVEDLAAG